MRIPRREHIGAANTVRAEPFAEHGNKSML
jgi:hypothetical protein